LVGQRLVFGTPRQNAPSSQPMEVKLPKAASRHRPFGPTEEELTRMNTRQLHPIPKDVGGGRKMIEREFERVFQIPGNGQGVNGAEPPIPDSCKEDNDKGMTSGEVITQITEADKKRLTKQLARGTAGRVPGLINWRLPLGDHGHGETITIAQQCVYIGNVSFLKRRPRMCQIMNHLMDTDPDLAWGRMRFANGKSPDVTISLACYKARYDLVETMAFHPSADYYLPTYKPMLKRPCPKLCLDELIEDLLDYNSGKGNDSRRADRDRCVRVLIRLHRKRHGVRVVAVRVRLEQRCLERVMYEKVGPMGVAMSALFLSY
jgi:hypothetical protein